MQKWRRVNSKVSSWLPFGSNFSFIIFISSVTFSYVLCCLAIVGTEFNLSLDIELSSL